jgi:hypothetical protein
VSRSGVRDVALILFENRDLVSGWVNLQEFEPFDLLVVEFDLGTVTGDMLNELAVTFACDVHFRALKIDQAPV